MRRSKTGALVLVADDDEHLRENIAEILEGEGYRVQLAGDGRATLDRLRILNEPCLLLLDLIMPVMDGFTVIDTLERDLSLPEVNVVAMTGGMTRSGYLGDVPLLQKPVEIPRLLVLVDRLTFPPRE